MSYDLYFFSRANIEPDYEAIIKYFEEMRYFKVTRAKHGTALINYENPNTTANFRFFKARDNCPFTVPNNFHYIYFSFTLNITRPSFYAFEAMPIVHEFIEKFDLWIFNPQDPRIKEMPMPYKYTKSELIELWENDNQFFSKALMNKAHRKVNISKEKMMKLWEYLYARDEIYKVLNNQDIYVPKMYIFRNQVNSELFTATIWGECVNAIIPECDYMLIGKNVGENEKEIIIHSYVDVVSVMNKYLDSFDVLPGNLKLFRSTELAEARNLFFGLFNKEPYHKYNDVQMLSIGNLIDIGL